MVRVRGSRSFHSMRMISSRRIAVAIANLTMVARGNAVPRLDLKRANRVSSSASVGRRSRSRPRPSASMRRSATRASLTASVFTCSPCNAAAWVKTVPMKEMSIASVAGPAPSAARSRPYRISRSRVRPETCSLPSSSLSRRKTWSLDRRSGFPYCWRSSI